MIKHKAREEFTVSNLYSKIKIMNWKLEKTLYNDSQ